jgi:hypothetical protein
MTLLQERPTEVAQTVTSRATRTVAYAELMGRHPELRDLGAPATVVTDAILWSV